MIWFWVLIWVEVVGSDGSGSGCGRWWLVAVSVAGGGWWLVAGGSGGGFRVCSGFLMVGF